MDRDLLTAQSGGKLLPELCSLLGNDSNEGTPPDFEANEISRKFPEFASSVKKGLGGEDASYTKSFSSGASARRSSLWRPTLKSAGAGVCSFAEQHSI